MITVMFAGVARSEGGGADKGLWGLHQPHGKRPDGTPGALSFQDQTGFQGEARIVKDSNGNEVYDEATITIYEGAIEDHHGKRNRQDIDAQLVATFGHEAEHDLDPMQVQETKRHGARDSVYHPINPDRTPKQGSPYWYSNQILKEIRESRKKRK